MHFTAMDLIGKFTPWPKGHQYIITVICMLMNYTWCSVLPYKGAYDTVHAYLVKVYSKVGGQHKILSDNGTEFKKRLFV